MPSHHQIVVRSITRSSISMVCQSSLSWLEDFRSFPPQSCCCCYRVGLLKWYSNWMCRYFKVSCRSTTTMDWSGISVLLTRALAQIRCVRLLDSMSLLGVLSEIPLPYMRRVEIGKCWRVGSDLDSFFRAHSETLRSLHFMDVFLPRSKAPSAGSGADGLTDRISRLVNKGYGGNLKNLTLNFDGSKYPGRCGLIVPTRCTSSINQYFKQVHLLSLTKQDCWCRKTTNAMVIVTPKNNFHLPYSKATQDLGRRHHLSR